MEMEKDNLIKELLGERVYKLYYNAKLDAWSEYDSQVTNWEIESYLYKF
jgi:glutamine synthetase